MCEIIRSGQVQEKVLAINRRIFGKRHPNTTIAAWNLQLTLKEMHEHRNASRLLDSDLAWLLNQDLEQLGAAQRQIAGMVREMIGGGADQD